MLIKMSRAVCAPFTLHVHGWTVNPDRRIGTKDCHIYRQTRVVAYNP